MKLGELFVDLGVNSGGAFSTISNFAFKFNNVAELADKMVKSISNIGGAKPMAELSQNILDLAKALSLTTNNIQGIKRAANYMGADWGTMTAKMQQFEKRRSNAIRGKDSGFLAEYAQYGLTNNDIVYSKNPLDVMQKVVAAISRVKTEREKQGLAAAAGFTVREMEAWQNYFDNQAKYDNDKSNLTLEQLKNNEKLNRNIATLSQKFSDIGIKLQENLMPTVDKIIIKVNEFADAIDKFLSNDKLKSWIEKTEEWWNKDGATQHILKNVLHPIETMKKNWDNLVYHSVGLFNELGLGNTGLGTDMGITAATIPVNPYLSAGMGSFTLSEGITSGLLNAFDSGTTSRLQFNPNNTTKPLEGKDLSFAQSFAYTFFKKKGYTDTSAKALMGNIMGESGFNPNALGDNGHSFGIAQWRDDRREALKKFAKERGMPVNSLLTQLEFLVSEKGESHKISPDVLNRLSLEDATARVVNKYERPDPKNRKNDIALRTDYARNMKQADLLEDKLVQNRNVTINNNKTVEINSVKSEDVPNIVMADNKTDMSEFNLGEEW